jgi:hypothetical protein
MRGEITLVDFLIAVAIRTLHSAFVSCCCKRRGLVAEVGGRCEVASDRCGWEELLAPGSGGLAAAREALVLEQGWAKEWTTRWKLEDGPVTCPVRDLAAVPLRVRSQCGDFPGGPRSLTGRDCSTW